ncbi:MAG TPA: hypothetical protein VK191_04110 [Symbiobacteriaceae bacterium]|nr:hypothetical protein [Symbiobacteriaceae bacterium]
MHPSVAPVIPAIIPGLVVGALLLISGAALTWRRAAEAATRPPDHAKAMVVMTAAMLAGMMAGLWGGLVGMGHLGTLWPSSLLGVEVGLLAGLLTGAPGGLIAALEGAMAGLMGGLMSPMLLAMAPESGAPFLSLVLLAWAWAGAAAACLLAPDLPRRWLLVGAASVSALVLGLWGAPW